MRYASVSCILRSPLGSAECTYLLWLNFRAFHIPGPELADYLKREAGLFFDDGYIFGEEGEGFERWNLACPERYIREGPEDLQAHCWGICSRTTGGFAAAPPHIVFATGTPV